MEKTYIFRHTYTDEEFILQNQRRIQNFIKPLKWSFMQKELSAFSYLKYTSEKINTPQKTKRIKKQPYLHLSSLRQKQPSRGVLRKRCSENMLQIYRRTPMPKCDFNKVRKQLMLYHCIEQFTYDQTNGFRTS